MNTTLGPVPIVHNLTLPFSNDRDPNLKPIAIAVFSDLDWGGRAMNRSSSARAGRACFSLEGRP